jgi:hypothetical protein
MAALEAVGVTLRQLIDVAERVSGLPRNAMFAMLVLGVGFALALLVRTLTTRFVREVASLLSSSHRSDDDVESTMSRHRIDVLLGRGAFWLVIVLTLMFASERLGLPVLNTWLGVVAAYLPRVFTCLVIIFTGVVIGSLGRGALRRTLPTTDHIDPERLGGVLQALIVGVSVLVAVQQLGVDVGFLTNVVTIALVGFFGASALAFGLGGRVAVANILAGHYVRELYEVGNTVRIQGLEGRIVRMTATAVILSTQEGETAVPTQLFVEALSTRVASRGPT